jgi:dolichol-phosphate mannosyltransferase
LITGPKRGLGEAYKRGIEDAMKRLSPDIVFEMDADGQHDPGLISLFVYLAEHGFSLVIGSRFAPGGSTPEFSRGRRVMSLVGSWMIRSLGGLPRIHDCTSGFRCIKTEVLKKCNFRFLSTRGYSFQSAALWELLQNGARVIEVPMTFRGRTYGESKLTLRDQVEFLINVVNLRFHQSKEFFRFVFVGLSGLLVNLGSYILLTRKTGIDIALASPIAIELSILSNYFLNDSWTFKYSRVTIPIYRRLVRFHAVAALAGLLNYLAFLTLVYYIHVYDILANVIGISTGMLVNYSLNSIWTWHKSSPMLDSTVGSPRPPNCHKDQSRMKQR